jgi:hypothetical protein
MNEVPWRFYGVDVGKRQLHATLLQGDRSASKTATNSPAGIAQLLAWLRNRKVERVHACLEATGGWSEDVAIALHDAGHVWMASPYGTPLANLGFGVLKPYFHTSVDHRDPLAKQHVAPPCTEVLRH